MQIFLSRCFFPILKLIEIAFGFAGSKYSKLQSIKSEKNQRFSLKFFGSSSNKKEQQNEKEIDSKQQMQTRQKTKIAETDFATKAVEFYTNNAISLQISKNSPIYREMFADDEEIEDEGSDSPLPEIGGDVDGDEDYFGNDDAAENTKKSQSGFVVKAKVAKKKKKEKKKVPTMSAPKVPTFGIGLSEISFRAAKTIKMNKKWEIIERVMALRGFDVFDQQTIRILIEDTQKNIEAQDY